MNTPKININFKTDLEFKMKHPDIRRLQRFLNSDTDTRVAKSGPGSPGNETDYYGRLTASAVLKFQLKHGVLRAANDLGAGRVGPLTRRKIQEVFNSNRERTGVSKDAPQIGLTWPVEKSFQTITQGFGVPWSANRSKKHTGIDIAIPAGKNVFVAVDGVVIKIGNLDTGGKWAQYVGVEHKNLGYCTAYLHVKPRVKVGTNLVAGDIIASIADISSQHLHFNFWKGSYDRVITQRGALPMVAGTQTSDPVFPSNFIDPRLCKYRYL